MKEFPIGPETLKKAQKTEAGKLAILLNRVLYSADNKHVVESFFGNKIEPRRWVAEDIVYCNSDEFPTGLPKIEGRPSYFETESLMRAIRDYLEFKSFEEVIP